MKSFSLVAMLAAALPLFAAGLAAAGEETPTQPAGFHGSIGLGVGTRPEYVGAKDRETRIQPNLALFYGDTLFLTGMTAGANLFRQRTAQGLTITAGPMLALRGGRKEGDNPALTGLGDIDRGLDAGGFVRVQMDGWQARADVRGSVTNDNGGTTVNLSLGKGWAATDQLRLRAAVDTSWASAEHMNTYFGIDTVQAANSRLPRYQPDAGFKSVGASLTADHAINREWAGFASVRYTRLIGGAADSPIVADLGSPNQVATTVGIKYRF